jgi:hypothetical protein
VKKERFLDHLFHQMTEIDRKRPDSLTARQTAAMKRAGPVLKVKDLQPRSAIFMLGGAPTAHEVLPEKWRLVPKGQVTWPFLNNFGMSVKGLDCSIVDRQMPPRVLCFLCLQPVWRDLTKS